MTEEEFIKRLEYSAKRLKRQRLELKRQRLKLAHLCLKFEVLQQLMEDDKK
jgi:hypothetical protein